MYVHPTFSPGTRKQTDMNNTSRLLSAHWQFSMPDLRKDEHKSVATCTYNPLHLQFSFPNLPTLINSYSFLFPMLKSARANLIIIIIQRYKKKWTRGGNLVTLKFRQAGTNFFIILLPFECNSSPNAQHVSHILFQKLKLQFKLKTRGMENPSTVSTFAHHGEKTKAKSILSNF